MEYYTSVENRGYLADPVELENVRLQTYKLENEVDQRLAYFATVSVMLFDRLVESDLKILNKCVVQHKKYRFPLFRP